MPPIAASRAAIRVNGDLHSGAAEPEREARALVAADGRRMRTEGVVDAGDPAGEGDRGRDEREGTEPRTETLPSTSSRS
jgi:hypothetical protein